MLTADIALEDALLDLIDNSVDAITTLHGHPLDARLILEPGPARPDGTIRITITSQEVKIEDDGCGIKRKDAETTAFRLGRISVVHGATLGVYGIGMKRALFKIGNSFEVMSRSAREPGFTAKLADVDAWKLEDTHAEDWDIPLGVAPKSAFKKPSGTLIRITDIRPEIAMQMRDESLISRLRLFIGRTYALLLDRYIRIFLNGKLVAAVDIPLGTSSDLKPAIYKGTVAGGKVSTMIVAGLSCTPDKAATESAGWYILCNGRVVLSADKTAATGWGVDGQPIYVQSFRQFIGIAFFFSAEPLLLPWRTTKRGLNPDSEAFQDARSTMWAIAKPVTLFLRSFYYEETAPGSTKKLQAALKPLPIETIGKVKPSEFTATARARRTNRDSVKVQYDATRREIQEAGKLIGETGASATRVGRISLEMLLEGTSG